MWHGIFITLHAAAGVVAFAAGCDALLRRRWFAVYRWSLVALVVFLALAVDWTDLDGGSRALFVAFLVLGGFMVWRAQQAARILAAGRADESRRYLRHIGFTLVALFDGFVVITVLNGGVAGWATAVVGVGVAVAGHFAVDEMERRLVALSAVSTPAPPTTGTRPGGPSTGASSTPPAVSPRRP